MNEFESYKDFCERYGLSADKYRSLQTYYLSHDMEASTSESELFEELEAGHITIQEYKAIRGL